MLVITWFWFEPSLGSGAPSSWNFPGYNFPTIYKMIFYCWTVVRIIRLSAPPSFLFQMRNVAANFKVLDIGSDNFDQVCVFYIVLPLYQKKAPYCCIKSPEPEHPEHPKTTSNHLTESPNHPQNTLEHPKNILLCPWITCIVPKRPSITLEKSPKIPQERPRIIPDYPRTFPHCPRIPKISPERSQIAPDHLII